MPVLDGISAAEQIAAARIAPVVMLTAFSQRELVERARDAGAMAYLVKPFTKADLVPAVEMAMARYDELTTLESEVADLRERLETRKLVDRAKGLLMDRHGLDEAAAYRWVQRTSMDRRMSMRQVAELVLARPTASPSTTDRRRAGGTARLVMCQPAAGGCRKGHDLATTGRRIEPEPPPPPPRDR